MPKLVTKLETSEKALELRIKRLGQLLAKCRSVPEEWLGKANGAISEGIAPNVLACLPCNNYAALVNAWKKALKWTDGLDCALSVMLATVASTKIVGDQLWVKIMGPASCGKSTLCEAISVNSKYVLAKSTIRGFHSGYQQQEGEDNSLITKVRNKTLVTKDGDTLLQSPNLGQILSEGRDVYDRTSRADYRNKAGKDHSGINMTWILCGTASLRSIDSSELGQRFLDCVIMEGIDDDFEDEILWRVANRVDRNMALESDGSVETNYEPELAHAMQMTGGYIDYLCKNATELLSQVTAKDHDLRKCTRLGKFVAFMRARPSKKQDENVEREFAPRLVSQHTRLMKTLSIVMNKTMVDSEIMRRVKKVALDTARGKTLQLADYLFSEEEGLETRALAMYTNTTEDETRKLLRFLRQIKVTELGAAGTGMSKTPKWKLTEGIRKLYQEVER